MAAMLLDETTETTETTENPIFEDNSEETASCVFMDQWRYLYTKSSSGMEKLLRKCVLVQLFNTQKMVPVNIS